MRKIYYYTHSGGYIQTISGIHTSLYDDITAFPNGKFLCHDIQGRKEKSEIWLMNEKGEEEKISGPIPIATNLPNFLFIVLTDEYPLEYFPKKYRGSTSERVVIMYLINFEK